MPSRTPAKRPVSLRIDRVKLSQDQVREAKKYLPPRADARFHDTLQAFEGELSYLRAIWISRNEQPLPANLRAELETVLKPASQLSARLAHLPFDNEGVTPSLTADAEFALRSDAFDLSMFRSMLRDFVEKTRAASESLSRVERRQSDGSARNRMRKEVRDAAKQSLGRFYRKHVAPARSQVRNCEREFVKWAWEQVEQSRVRNARDTSP